MKISHKATRWSVGRTTKQSSFSDCLNKNLVIGTQTHTSMFDKNNSISIENSNTNTQ